MQRPELRRRTGQSLGRENARSLKAVSGDSGEGEGGKSNRTGVRLVEGLLVAGASGLSISTLARPEVSRDGNSAPSTESRPGEPTLGLTLGLE